MPYCWVADTSENKIIGYFELIFVFVFYDDSQVSLIMGDICEILLVLLVFLLLCFYFSCNIYSCSFFFTLKFKLLHLPKFDEINSLWIFSLLLEHLYQWFFPTHYHIQARVKFYEFKALTRERSLFCQQVTMNKY